MKTDGPTGCLRDLLAAKESAPTQGLAGLGLVMDAAAKAHMYLEPGQDVHPAYTVFASPVAPMIETDAFLKWLDDKLPCSGESFMLAWVLMQRAGVPITRLTLHRLIVAALVVAMKARDDVCYANVTVERATSMPKGSICTLETALLEAIGWRCYVAPEEYSALLAQCLEEERAVEAESAKAGAPLPPPRRFCTTTFTLTREAAHESVGLLFIDTRIVGVVPNGACDRAGMKRGMVLKTVNGKPVAWHHEVAAAINLAGATIDLEIFPVEAPPSPAAQPWLGGSSVSPSSSSSQDPVWNVHSTSSPYTPSSPTFAYDEFSPRAATPVHCERAYGNYEQPVHDSQYCYQQPASEIPAPAAHVTHQPYACDEYSYDYAAPHCAVRLEAAF
eukprot:TRINITY_DN12769_c0_g1_i1.p1 TRINITY_DN12769_c0_g1~~TRINITY_DN12769_c0_g1_i1.p1  ORF type:complete len:388 (+),score=99.87 TRINITY_DN12769_c0_g1_i1:52-1215(+)